MPTMNEIYEMYSNEYNSLVDYEDYQNNLEHELLKISSFKNKAVCELGMGTGRLTKIIAKNGPKIVYGFDRAKAMLDSAKTRLLDFNNIEYSILDNVDFHRVNKDIDILIEGWSLGHTLIENWDKRTEIIDNIINHSKQIIKPEGLIIIIETLGSNVDEPTPPGEKLKEFYGILENNYKFSKTVIRTDYKFNSNEEAQKVFGFFFGDWIIDSIKKCNSNIIKEFTGIWYKKLI